MKYKKQKLFIYRERIISHCTMHRIHQFLFIYTPNICTLLIIPMSKSNFQHSTSLKFPKYRKQRQKVYREKINPFPNETERPSCTTSRAPGARIPVVFASGGSISSPNPPNDVSGLDYKGTNGAKKAPFFVVRAKQQLFTYRKSLSSSSLMSSPSTLISPTIFIMFM